MRLPRLVLATLFSLECPLGQSGSARRARCVAGRIPRPNVTPGAWVQTHCEALKIAHGRKRCLVTALRVPASSKSHSPWGRVYASSNVVQCIVGICSWRAEVFAPNRALLTTPELDTHTRDRSQSPCATEKCSELERERTSSAVGAGGCPQGQDFCASKNS